MPDIVSVEYQQTGNSTSTNPYGMREMQERAFEYRDAQYMLLKSPPASGKSRALMFLGLDKLINQGIKKVKPLGDGEGVFTQGLGMLVSKPAQGFGLRSWRYSMLVEDGDVTKQFIEEGKNDASDDNDPFEVSDAQTMLTYLKGNK